MKFVLAFMATLFVTSFSVCAADLDQVDYYSLSPVQSLSPTVNSAFDYAVQPLSATSWDTSDQTNLSWIRNAFYNPNSGYVSNSLLGWVKKLADNSVSLSGLVSDVDDLTSGLVGTSNSVLWYAREIYNDTSELHNIYLSASSSALSLQEINDAIQNDTDSLKDLLSLIWGHTDSIDSVLDDFFNGRNYVDWGYFDSNGSYVPVKTDGPFTVDQYVPLILYSFLNDAVLNSTRQRTFYGLVSQLQQVLASDDDLALANSQKANREEIEDTFLNGSSGSTSLGASDFGDLSDVGGSVKDMLSLDGNATVSSFVSGMTAADSAGNGWFSEETRAQLDSVTASASTYSRSDPYNMSGWEERYYWLIGDDENG